MLQSSEFIRGYTEMIVLAILLKEDDYVYSIATKINEISNGSILISNPSLVISLKKMVDENKVIAYNVLNEKNVNRKFYKITDYGKTYYKENLESYLFSLEKLFALVKGE